MTSGSADDDVGPPFVVYVGNLWYGTTRPELERMFADYRVVDIRVSGALTLVGSFKCFVNMALFSSASAPFRTRASAPSLQRT